MIVQIGEAEVKRFKDLQEAINQRVPGDEIEVKYVRLNQLRTVKLRLGKLKDGRDVRRKSVPFRKLAPTPLPDFAPLEGNDADAEEGQSRERTRLRNRGDD